MREHGRGRSISGLAALLLLGVFAVGILSVLLGGAQVYRRLTERGRRAYDSRTCVQYLTTKVRQAPSPDAISLGRFGAGDALLISQRIGGRDYLTRVYCHEGWLMELFTVAEGDFAPEDGERILQTRRLWLDWEGPLLRAELTDGNGAQASFLLLPRGREEAVP